jgi:hypothetical protein
VRWRVLDSVCPVCEAGSEAKLSPAALSLSLFSLLLSIHGSTVQHGPPSPPPLPKCTHPSTSASQCTLLSAALVRHTAFRLPSFRICAWHDINCFTVLYTYSPFPSPPLNTPNTTAARPEQLKIVLLLRRGMRAATTTTPRKQHRFTTQSERNRLLTLTPPL